MLGELEAAGINFEMAAELYRVEECPALAALCFESSVECFVQLGTLAMPLCHCHCHNFTMGQIDQF